MAIEAANRLELLAVGYLVAIAVPFGGRVCRGLYEERAVSYARVLKKLIEHGDSTQKNFHIQAMLEQIKTSPVSESRKISLYDQVQANLLKVLSVSPPVI